MPCPPLHLGRLSAGSAPTVRCHLRNDRRQVGRCVDWWRKQHRPRTQLARAECRCAAGLGWTALFPAVQAASVLPSLSLPPLA